MDIKSELNRLFPNLPNDYNYELVSKNNTLLFNCIAYTLDIYDEWVWTSESWPWKYVQRTPIIESYKLLYKYYKYEECNNDSYEVGYDKIVFYALNNIPKPSPISFNFIH